MLYDTHMHTKWSGDSEAIPTEMIASAKAKGLSGLTFTDHLDWDFPTLPHKFDLDVPNYLTEMQTLAAEYTDDHFSVHIGLELGLQTHLTDKHHALLAGNDFDFVIGSVHQLDRADPYYDEFWENRDFRETYQYYFECTLENIEAFPDFDALGHIDYISRYGQRVAKSRRSRQTNAAISSDAPHPSGLAPASDGILHYHDHASVIDAIFEFLIRHDKALEVNTAPYRYGFSEPNPSRQMLKRYHELGGRMVTIGADAHKPADVAIGFDRLPELLRDCGFTSYYIFSKRTPQEIPL